MRRDYTRAHGRPPRLLRPRTFTEKMQWRKLFDANPAFVIFNDKIAMREWVERVIGRSVTVPLLWTGTNPREVPLDTLPRPCVIKPSHLSGRRLVLDVGDVVDVAARHDEMTAWLAQCHGSALTEPGYLGIPRRLLVEPMLREDDGGFVPEYKIYCFDGAPKLVKVRTIHDAQGRRVTRTLFTPSWKRLPIRLGSSGSAKDTLTRPEALGTMLGMATTLAQGFDHLRIDFYLHRGVPLLSEITPYDNSGLVPFHPSAADRELGRAWRVPWPVLRAARAITTRAWDDVPLAATIDRPAGNP